MPPDPDSPPQPAAAAPAVARRRFLQALSRDAVDGAIQLAGIAAGFHGVAGDAMGAVLGRAPATSTAAGAAAPAAVLRAFRIEGLTIRALDASRYPSEVVEVACARTAEVAAAIRGGQVVGASLVGELAAYAAWLAVLEARGAPPAVRRTRIRTMGAALRGASPGVAAIDHATRWMVDAWDRSAADASDDATLEAACRVAADSFAARLAAERMEGAAVAAGILAAHAEGPVRLLTLGGEGIPDAARAGGAAGAAMALAGAGRAVQVTVLETRAREAAARMTAWGLAVAGVEVRVAPDAAVGALLGGGDVDAVVIGADTIAVDGSLLGPLGSYPLAVLAERHAIPLMVVAPSVSVGAVAEGAVVGAARAARGAPVDARRPSSALPSGTSGARHGAQDVVPQALVSAFVVGPARMDPPMGPFEP